MAPTTKRSGTEKQAAPSLTKESEFLIDKEKCQGAAINVPYCCVAWPAAKSANSKGIPARLFTSPTTQTPADYGAQLQGYVSSDGAYHGFELDASMLYPLDKEGRPAGPPVTQREALALYQATKLTASVQKSKTAWVDFQRHVMAIPYNRETGKAYPIELDEVEPEDDPDVDNPNFPYHWVDAPEDSETSEHEFGHFAVSRFNLATESLKVFGLLYPFELDKGRAHDGLDDNAFPIPLGEEDGRTYSVSQAELDACANDEERETLQHAQDKLAAEEAPQVVFMLEVTADTSEDEGSGYQPQKAQRNVLHRLPQDHLPRLQAFIKEYELDTPLAKAIAEIPLDRGPLDLSPRRAHNPDHELFGPGVVTMTVDGNAELVIAGRAKDRLGYFPIPKSTHPHHAALEAILGAITGRHPSTASKQPRDRKGWSSMPTEQMEELENESKRLKALNASNQACFETLHERIAKLEREAKERENAKVYHARDGQAVVVTGTNTLVPGVAGASIHLLDQTADGSSFPLQAEHGARVCMVASRPNLSAFPGLYAALV
jgi:hypothetical protein